MTVTISHDGTISPLTVVPSGSAILVKSQLPTLGANVVIAAATKGVHDVERLAVEGKESTPLVKLHFMIRLNVHLKV